MGIKYLNYKSISIFILSCLFWLSIYFFQLRTIFTDMAFHVFSIITENNFAIQNYRFVAICTQIFPLISLKFGLELKTILILYSSSFIIIQALIFLIISLGLKNKKYALLLILFNILICSHLFFWIQSELQQAMAFLILFFAIFENFIYKKSNSVLFILSLLLIPIFIFGHPLLIFPSIFILGNLFWSNKSEKNKIILVTIIVILIFLIKKYLFATAYDSEAQQGLNNIKNIFPHIFNIQSNKNFIHYLIEHYYFLIIFTVANIFYLLKDKKIIQLFWSLFFIVTYTFLINLNYVNGAEQFYLENQYAVLVIFVSYPFLEYVFIKISDQKQFLLLALIFSCMLIRVFSICKIYNERLDWQKQFLIKTEKLEYKKLVVSEEKVPMKILKMSWATPYEFWLISTLENKQTRSIIINPKIEELQQNIEKNKIFISTWGVFDYANFNKKYFIFSDTSKYVIY